MARTAVGGAILAVVAFFLILFGDILNLDLERAGLVGVALGAVVALVPDRSPLLRAGGAAIGFLLAWGTYAVRAAVLPDTDMGRALAALLLLLVLMGISVATLTNIPLWSLLVGAAAMGAAYETTVMILPSAFPYESPTAASQMALAAGVGFLAGSFLAPTAQRGGAEEAIPRPRPDRSDEEPSTKLDSLMTSKNEG
jgi:hypothetical protein